jgi:DNA-directed RNA polymerase omega subunit
MTAKTHSNAGLTSQEAALQIGNRYDLVLIAARRVRELHRGDTPRVNHSNNPSVLALLEIEQGHVGRDYLLLPPDPNLGRRDRRNHNREDRSAK